jgi:hypothetical protein
MPRCLRCGCRWRELSDACPACNFAYRPTFGPFPFSFASPSPFRSPLFSINSFFDPCFSLFSEAPQSQPRRRQTVTPSEFDHRQVELGDVQNETKCSICLDEFKRGENVCELPCKHIFHDGCVREWLKREATCPVCRLPLRPNEEHREEGQALTMDPLSFFEQFFRAF